MASRNASWPAGVEITNFGNASSMICIELADSVCGIQRNEDRAGSQAGQIQDQSEWAFLGLNYHAIVWNDPQGFQRIGTLGHGEFQFLE